MPYDPLKHGVSYSMLSDFMECRQKSRFRATGVKTKGVPLPLVYGTIVHEILDLAHTGIAAGEITKIPGRKRVEFWCRKAEEIWIKQNPHASTKSLSNLELSLALAEAVMPAYFRFHRKTLFKMKWDDTLTEKFHKFKFKIAGYTEVPILVKMDSAFWQPTRNRKTRKLTDRLWLFETKTGARIDEAEIVDLLPMSLQQNIYLIALHRVTGKKPRGAVRNFVRRPGLYRRKDEPLVKYKDRVVEDVEKRPEHYFKRFRLLADGTELEKCKGDLQGVLVEFIKWWEGKTIHYRSTNACKGQYGFCTYWPICAQNDWSTFTGGPEDG
jgi:hypothetical protein